MHASLPFFSFPRPRSCCFFSSNSRLSLCLYTDSLEPTPDTMMPLLCLCFFFNFEHNCSRVFVSFFFSLCLCVLTAESWRYLCVHVLLARGSHVKTALTEEKGKGGGRRVHNRRHRLFFFFFRSTQLLRTLFFPFYIYLSPLSKEVVLSFPIEWGTATRCAVSLVYVDVHHSQKAM